MLRLAALFGSSAVLSAAANRHVQSPEALKYIEPSAAENLLWKNFKAENKRVYENEAEEAEKFLNFRLTVLKINELNKKSGGNATYGINKFADYSPAEFKRLLGYKKSHKKNTTSNKKKFAPRPAGWKASSKDWRGTGAITAVKNQGQCGSCWAFSATEAVETAVYFSSGSTVKLSPQQVVSCDTTDDGCDGGDPENAYQYIEEAGGLDPADDYPYTSGGGDTGSCKVDTSDFAAKVTGFQEISTNADEESDMMEEISKSPMSICVDAESWQTYTGGVVDKSTCKTELDHCVQVIGYDADKNYWIVRNSWGTDWGEDGYIRVKAGENACGIAEEATIAKAEKTSSGSNSIFV